MSGNNPAAGGGGGGNARNVEEELVRDLAPKLGFAAGRRTTALGDMVSGRGALYKVEPKTPYKYTPGNTKVTKIENAIAPAPPAGGGGGGGDDEAARKAARRAEIIAAQAARDAQQRRWNLIQAARDTEAAAIAAEERARRVNTNITRKKAAEALEKAKQARRAMGNKS